MTRQLAAIVADLEQAHGLMARALGELVLHVHAISHLPSAAQVLPKATPAPAPVATPAPKPAPAPKAMARPNNGRESSTFYDYHGERKSIGELAALAGCTYATMYGRLQTWTPEQAVARGKADRSKSRVMPRSPGPTFDPVPTPPQRAPSVFDVTPARHGAHSPAAPLGRVPLMPVVDKAGFAADEPVIVPADVKRTVAPTPPGRFDVDNAPSTFGRIGEYERTGSALERAMRAKATT